PTPSPSVAVCAATPRSDCRQPGKAVLNVLVDPINPVKRKLIWKWLLGGIDASDMGDPISGTTNYRLCLYDDGVLHSEAGIAAGGICDGKPCWSALGSGSKFKSKNGNGDGVGLVLTKIDPAK